MSAALLERPVAPRCALAAAGARTLEERLNATFRALAAGAPAECPVCHGSMRPESGGGRCGDCGARLS